MVGQAVKTQVGEPLAEKLTLARWRGEVAPGKRRFRQRQCGKAFGQQFVEVNVLCKRSAAECFVVVSKTRLVKPHARRQLTKNLRIGFAVTQRRNGRAIQQHIGVAVRQVNVPVLQLGGGGQDVVGVVGSVGLEMLKHHGK